MKAWEITVRNLPASVRQPANQVGPGTSRTGMRTSKPPGLAAQERRGPIQDPCSPEVTKRKKTSANQQKGQCLVRESRHNRSLRELQERHGDGHASCAEEFSNLRLRAVAPESTVKVAVQPIPRKPARLFRWAKRRKRSAWHIPADVVVSLFPRAVKAGGGSARAASVPRGQSAALWTGARRATR